MKTNKEKIKISTIVGARPQFIKAAAINRAISEHNNQDSSPQIEEKIIHTGQHYDDNLSKVFFEELSIPEPDYDLEVGSGRHGEQTGLMLERIEQVLIKEKPDVCIVYGDTNTTLAGALSAAKLHIPVAHVEAGLRSFNRRMPEEINRVLTDHISDYSFCPTTTAVKNLESEGITKGVFLVGDVMYDSALFYAKKSEEIEKETLKELSLHAQSYYLATVHRAENTDNPEHLTQIVNALNEISESDCPVVLPLHPRTVKKVDAYGLEFSKDVKVVSPVPYLKMVSLEKKARVILTDSGGVQKEAYFYKVPCITLREETEWVETVEAGWNIVVGPESERITNQVENYRSGLTNVWEAYYGDGYSANKICEVLCR